MSSHKKHNSLVLDFDVDGLPPDWRRRVEDAVRHVGKLYELYVTTVQAGVSANPPRILVSVSREGREQAWNGEAEAVLRTRIIHVLADAEEEHASKRGEIDALNQAVAVAARRRGFKPITAVETRKRDAHTMRALASKRVAVLMELKPRLLQADLPPGAHDLSRVALDRMKQADRWALWAQLLLAVDEVGEAMGADLQNRLRSLI